MSAAALAGSSRAPTQRQRLHLVAGLTLLLAGCAQPLPAPAPIANYWSGRLALQVQDAPSQSFHAGFELTGQADAGTLTLLNPLGNLLALLRWNASGALLQQGERQERYASLQALTQELTGTALPVAALFDWLAGHTGVQASGWQVDLSDYARGRIVATRTSPAPQAQLRIALER
ncbi:hypothetical protein GCM10022279_17710 [Comamonas faecalis]|uniref:Outer-membrane lipoprotein LolB n=1 Tax=Comamonas faecalis TaxID=1387849 RepID=A0ABP7R9R0_9BURK